MLRMEDLGRKLASETKKASMDAGVLCLRMDYYPSNTIRWEILFVKKKEGGETVSPNMAWRARWYTRLRGGARAGLKWKNEKCRRWNDPLPLGKQCPEY